MVYKKSMIIIMLTIFLFSIASVCAGDANQTADIDNALQIADDNQAIGQTDDGVEAVDSTESASNDNENVLGNSRNVTGNTFNDIKTAIASSVSGDTIYLENQTYTGSGSEIVIDKTLTLIGNGATLDANGLSCILKVRAGNVAISDITFVNGNCPLTHVSLVDWLNGGNPYSGGGAINVEGTGCKITGCTFENNYGPNGGAIFAWGNNMNITNCKFSNNTVVRESEGFDHLFTGNGASIFLLCNNSYVGNCEFSYNNASDRDGGGIYWSGNDGNMVNCTFTSNYAYAGGGAVYISGKNVKIRECSFKGNKVDHTGGAITASGDSFGVYNSSFENQEGKYGGAIYCNEDNVSFDIADCEFKANRAVNGYGGAINSNGKYASVRNCKFTINEATTDGSDGKGGAIYFGGNAQYGEVIGCEFYSNDAATDGGAFSSVCNNGKIINSTFVSNRANNGGAIIVQGKSFTVNGCDFWYNTAVNDGGAIKMSGNNNIVSECYFNLNNATFGGAAYLENFNHGTVHNCNFVENSVSFNGGSIFWNSNAGNVSNCNFIGHLYKGEGIFVGYGVLSGNNARHGGAIAVADNMHIYIYDCDFENNSAMRMGGAIGTDFDWGGSDCDEFFDADIVNCNFVNNWVTDLDIFSAGDGGAVSSMGSNGVIVNCSFVGNSAVSDRTYAFRPDGGVGGALRYICSPIYNCTFIGNVAGKGGAISVLEAPIYNSVFINNSARMASGGAITIMDGRIVVNCTFVNNFAKYDGGAINSIWDGNNIVANCTFVNNVAENDGGAVWFGSKGTFSNCIFEGNSAGSSGGAIADIRENSIIEDCSFDGNSAGSWGGAVFNMGEGATIKDSSFENNVANNQGGAINNVYGNIFNCNFTGNRANEGGAVDYLRGDISNCNFTSNSASSSSALNIRGWSSVKISNCNFDYNSAGDGALVVKDSSNDVKVMSCNFTGNSGDEGSAVTFYCDNGLITDCIFTGNDGYHGSAVMWTGLNGKVSNCKFTGNNVDMYDGGAICWAGDDGIVTDSSFVSNRAQRGGAVYWGGNGGELHDCIFTDNSAYFIGGAVYWVGNEGNLADCIFTGNNANAAGGLYMSGDDSLLSDCQFINNTAGSDGGAVDWYQAENSNISNCIFTGNNANAGGGLMMSADGCLLSGCQFINNTAVSTGGAVDWRMSEKISDCIFTGNNASDGGALYLLANGCILSGCSFMNNNADFSGGAINANARGCTLSDLSFNSNRAWDGGAVWWHGDWCTISSSSFNSNHARYGGALYWYMGSHQNIGGCEFTYNVADARGGAIYLLESECFIGNSRFMHNRVSNASLSTENKNDYVTITFETNEIMNAVYSTRDPVGFGNVTYYCNGEVITTDNPEESFHESGQVIVIEVYDSTNALADNQTLITDSNGQVTYDCFGVDWGNYTYRAYHPDNGIYAYVETAGNFELTDTLSDDFTSLQTYINRIGENKTLRLLHNYTYTDGVDDYLAGGIVISKRLTVEGSGYTINAQGKARVFNVQASDVTINNLTIINAKNNAGSGGAIYFSTSGTVSNCNFINNTADDNGGAINFAESGTVTNCNFNDNQARNYGGAINMPSGTVTNCNFTNNHANSYDGGAINMNLATITNCNFNDNRARNGAALCFNRYYSKVTNCNFANNAASVSGGAIYTYLDSGVTADTCIFKTGSDGTVRTRILPPTLNIDNSTTFYKPGEKLTFDLKTNSGMPVDNGNILISVYYKNNGSCVGDYSCLSGEGWTVDLPAGSYYAVFNTEYAEFKPINRTIKVIPNIEFYANVTQVTSINRTVNITAISNIPNDIIEGKLLFILPNSTEITANYNADGTWWAVYTFEDYGDYNVDAFYSGLDGVTITDATIRIGVDVPINVNDVSINYGEVADVIVGVPESINGQNITITVNGNSKNAVVEDGEARASFADLAVGKYDITADYSGDGYNLANSTTAKLTVNKVSPEIVVSASVVDFGKDLTVTVQMPADAARRPTVTIGDQSKAVTMRNGKGTVKFSGLVVGTYTVVVSYNGDANYLKASANATAKVKPIPEIIVSANDVGYGSTLVVTVQMPADAARRPTVTIGNQSKAVTMRNGTGTVKFTGLDVGTYDIVASYNGDADYGKASAATTAKVKPLPEITVYASDIIQGEDLVVTVQLPSDVTRRPTVTVGGESKLVTMRNGVGSVKFTGLALGTYSIDVSYNGDANYGKASIRTSVKVNRGPAEINVTANPVSYGEDVIIDVQLPSDVTRRVSIIVGNETKMVSLKNGTGSAKFSGLAVGTYDVSVEYSGDTKYLKSSQNTTVKVNKATPDIQITADDINYGKTLTVGIQLPSDVSRRATVKIDGVSKYVTLKNGVGSVKFTDLSKGTHDVIVSYDGDANYNKASATTTINVN